MPDRLDLVAAGLRPAAILNTRRIDETLTRAAKAGLAAEVWRRAGEDDRGRLAPEDGAAQVYLARSPEDARRLRDLDRAVRDADRPELPRESHALGAALGYPDCCAWAYPHTAFEVPGEGEDVRWARNFAWRAGPGRVGPWSPWLNFHAARVFGLEFFEHLPCCPWCRPTQAKNQALVAALHDASGASRIRDALSQSVVLYPDGRFLPFLCTGFEAGVLSVTEPGVLRSALRPHFADRALDALPAGIPDALRMGRRGWEARVEGCWGSVATEGPPPVVLAFTRGGTR
ncbi:MAG: hypothetical protein ABIK09_10145 [Pseudomonadota bacterium]